MRRGWQNLKKLLRNSLIIILLFLIDLVSKIIFKDNSIINTGGVWGILQGYNFLFILIALIVLFVFIYIFVKNQSLGFAFFISGLAGNLFDRIFYSGVIDFIDLGFWPSFNLADVFIVIGVIICLIEMRKK